MQSWAGSRSTRSRSTYARSTYGGSVGRIAGKIIHRGLSAILAVPLHGLGGA